MDVYATFLRSIRRLGSPAAGDRIMVAVSGGADSVALLHLLMVLRQGDQPFAMAVAHLNHGVRGTEGATDAAFVADLARELNLPLLSGKRVYDQDNPDPVSADLTSSVPPSDDSSIDLPSEDELRRIRRTFYMKKAREWGANRIAVGHTRDDQAETALLNLLRGTGSRGLGGIRPTTRLSAYKHALKVGDSIPIGSASGALIIRPLLEVNREDLRGWLLEKQFPWREDRTNAEPRYLRNRVRDELLPLLENLRPGARETVARAATLLQDDDDLLNRLARAELAKLTLSTNISKDKTTDLPHPGEPAETSIRPGSPTLDARSLAGLPRPLARRVVRIAAANSARAADAYNGSKGTSAGSGALSLSGAATGETPLERAPLPARSGPPAADRTNEATGPAWAPGSRQVEAVLDMAAAGKGGRIDLGRGNVACLKAGRLTFETLAGKPESPAP